MLLKAEEPFLWHQRWYARSCQNGHGSVARLVKCSSSIHEAVHPPAWYPDLPTSPCQDASPEVGHLRTRCFLLSRVQSSSFADPSEILRANYEETALEMQSLK